MRTRIAIAAVVVAATLSGVGCGGDDDGETPSPSSVIERYYASTQDPKDQCATLSKASLDQFGSGGLAACQTRTIASTKKARGAKAEKEIVKGDAACVRFKVVKGGKGIATLVKEGSDWKVDGFHSGLEPTKSAARACGDREAEEKFEREMEGGEKGAEGEAEREREREKEESQGG